VAAACDDGVLRLFTAEGLEPGLTYAKSLPGLGSRLLSVAWHPDGASLVTGTAAGTLHAWHLASGRELLRISVGALRLLPTASRVLTSLWGEQQCGMCMEACFSL
jgi:WD40 repeat protein